MIIKLVGMATVFLSSSALGFCLGECLCARERELGNLADAVEMMSGEVTYTALPLRDVVLAVTPRLKGACSEMFSYISEELKEDVPLSTAWENAIEKAAPSMYFKKTDALFLTKNSYLLTAYELEEQKNRLLELKEKILFLKEDALRVKNKNTGLFRMLGVYGGALLCVIIF